MFEEFMAPYYRKLLARAKELKLLTIVDTDGDVTKLVPWLQALGVEGVLPLERQAGVDGNLLRKLYPKLRMVGHYNKLVMHKGEAAIDQERRVYSECGPSDAAWSFAGAIPGLSSSIEGVDAGVRGDQSSGATGRRRLSTARMLFRSSVHSMILPSICAAPGLSMAQSAPLVR